MIIELILFFEFFLNIKNKGGDITIELILQWCRPLQSPIFLVMEFFLKVLKNQYIQSFILIKFFSWLGKPIQQIT